MKIGKMRHRIAIKSLSTTQDSFGEQVETYTDVCTVWASVEPLVGKEYFVAEQANSEVSIKVRIRYRTGINDKMVVFFGSRKLLIVSPPINSYEKNRELILMCKELS
jgi:SPP1 family predicted phage head-tail adaptor